jgi:hypothetical protein
MSTTLTPAQVHELRYGCIHYTHRLRPSYGYHPSLAAGIIFVVLFGLSMAGHIFQAIRTRQSIFIICTVGAMSMFSTK